MSLSWGNQWLGSPDSIQAARARGKSALPRKVGGPVASTCSTKQPWAMLRCGQTLASLLGARADPRRPACVARWQSGSEPFLCGWPSRELPGPSARSAPLTRPLLHPRLCQGRCLFRRRVSADLLVSDGLIAPPRKGESRMGFFTGRVTFLRYRVDGTAPKLFGPEHLDQLASRAIGKQQTESKDGVAAGWIAGDDILDLGFDLAKNVIADTLHFALRLDTQKLPADLLRAYARAELQALAAENPSGRPSAKQK